MTLRQRLATALLLALAGAPAGAASIYLQPSSDTVVVDELFTVSLLINASDAPGAHPGLYGGEVVVDWDPTQLAYVDFGLSGGVNFFSGPTQGTAGALQTVTIGFDNAPDTGTVGTFTFRVVGPPEVVASLGIADSDAFFGTFAAYVPTYQPFYPTFTGTSVTTVIPLPGAAWLFMAGVAAALGRARRRTAAR